MPGMNEKTAKTAKAKTETLNQNPHRIFRNEILNRESVNIQLIYNLIPHKKNWLK